MSPAPIGSVRLTWLCLATLVVSGCAERRSASAHATGGPILRPSAIEAHMRYLASDLMEGREAGTRGYDLAAGYVTSVFQQLSLRPAGAHDTYMQPVPLQAEWLVRDAARMIVRPSGSRATRLILGQDFAVLPSSFARRAS